MCDEYDTALEGILNRRYQESCCSHESMSTLHPNA